MLMCYDIDMNLVKLKLFLDYIVLISIIIIFNLKVQTQHCVLLGSCYEYV